jgi:hypothetical protein
MFEGDLMTSQKGEVYQATFSEFFQNLKTTPSKLTVGGLVHVINSATMKMLPFIEKFDIVEGNTIDTPKQLLKLLNQYFEPPLLDICSLQSWCSGYNAWGE